MPIYEFYCPVCHTIFSFLSRRAGTRKRPDCPRCGRPRLEKLASSFAVSTGRTEPAGTAGGPEPDEAGIDRAMEELAREAEASDDDPRAAARLMRRLHDSAGLPMGEGLREAIQRMEAGEDPERIEEELGDRLDQTEPLPGGRTSGSRGPRRPRGAPAVDRTLYEL